MVTRELGATGQKISALGLGCMGMSEFYGPADQEEALSTVHYALDCGLNFLDTADIYGMGKNETLLGLALKGRRDDAFLATKFGIVCDEAGNFVGENGRPDYVQQACEASLQRLGVSVIDLYYQHRVDSLVPIEETVGAMAQLVEQGKVRYLGLSEANPSTLRRAHAIHPIAALQTEYSLWSREPEKALLDTWRELAITFIAYSPLGRGFLTGQMTNMDGRSASASAALSGRELGQEYGTREETRNTGCREGHHHRETRPRLGMGSGPTYYPACWHEATAVSRGKSWSLAPHPYRAGVARTSTDCARWRSSRRTLSYRWDASRKPLMSAVRSCIPTYAQAQFAIFES